LDLIKKYFPELSAAQMEKFARLESLYREWNEKVNVISRKDIDHLEERHILHSLSIAKFISFRENERVLDVGTGGGFPGIPLAILFEHTHFTLVDSIEKKMKVVADITDQLQLQNVTCSRGRAEEMKGQYDFIVSRAVAPISTICSWTKYILSHHANRAYKSGWIFLKGGDLREEIKEAGRKAEIVPVSNFFSEEFFREKSIVFIKN
jgi:16S rRNA (guanine527-N7)-methyltransferase